MAATQLNTSVSLIVGGQTSFGANYIVESCETPDFDVTSDRVPDENNVCVQELVFQRAPRIKAQLLAKTGADPATDFPIKGMCTIAGFTTYVVDACTTSKVAGVTKVSVDLCARFTNTVSA